MQKHVNPAIIKKVEDLRQALHRHNYRYYVLDDPEISDSEYDRIMQELIDWRLPIQTFQVRIPLPCV